MTDQIVLDRVCFSYSHRHHEKPVLSDVSCVIRRGETVGIVGPNGAGKSTLLAIISGAISPRSGEITIFGKSPRLARVGMVWQRTYDSIYPWWSAWENAAFPLRLKGFRRAIRRRRVEELCAEFDFTEGLDRRPYELSGGELQKVCMIRALLSEPDFLLLDEPFSNLSFDASNDLMDHIQRVQARRNLTVLLVSHSYEQSVFMADTVVKLQGNPATLDPANALVVNCPYPRTRPLQWMLESSFRQQVLQLRGDERKSS